ncbi:hypothetical protein ABPG75_004562 [Micractinium tetrahymenae]
MSAAEWLVSHPIDAGTWFPGDPWPEEEPAELERRRRLRQARPDSAPPLLSLSLGPFSVSLIPRSQPQRWTEGEAAAAAELEAPAGLGAALPPHVCPAVAALQAALAERAPEAVQQLAAAGEPVDAAFYARWLKARGGCVMAAAAGIAAHAAWRIDFLARAAAAIPAGGPSASSSSSSGADGSAGVPEAAIADELAARKALLQGLDTHGCPVIVVQASRHDMGRRDLAQTKRLIVFVLDTACASADPRRNPAGQISCLFDLSGLRPRNLDARALLAIFELLQNHYPERLNSLYFLNAPLLFWGVWRIVSPFVHAATRRKIHFIGGAAGRRQLLDRIPPEVLPAQYGGTAELVPIDAAAAAWRRQQQQAAQAAAEALVRCSAAAAAGAAGGGGPGAALAGAAAAARRRAGAAAGAAHRLVHGKVLRPVGSAAARAVRRLQHGQHGQRAAPAGDLSEQQRRSLLAQVVLTHVLLVGLLLRMLQRVLGRPLQRRQLAAGEGRPASPYPPAEDADAAPADEGADELQARGGARRAAEPAGPVGVPPPM